MNKKEIVLKTAVSILIIVLIVYFVGLEEIKDGITKTKIEYLLLVSGFFLLSMFITTLAILPLIKTKNTYKIFKFRTISWSAGLFLPSKIGEIVFPLMLKKEGIETKQAIAIFFIDRFVSFSIMGIIAFLGLIKFFEIKFNFTYLIIFFIAFLILLISKNKIKIIQKTQPLIKQTEDYLKREKRAILINYVFSLLNFILMFLVIKTLFLSLNQEVSLIDIALISCITLIIGVIPFTINGLGLRQGAMIFLYSLVGVKPEYTILVAFVFFVCSYGLGAIFLALYWSEFSFILKRKSDKEND